MSDVYRHNRKMTDAQVIPLNSVGLSLATIGRILGCNPATVAQRLKALGIPPADTRRAFMEEIFLGMTPDQQAWLQAQLGGHTPVKNFVRSLILNAYIASKTGDSHAA